jgi:hypothetical protein
MKRPRAWLRLAHTALAGIAAVAADFSRAATEPASKRTGRTLSKSPPYLNNAPALRAGRQGTTYYAHTRDLETDSGD